MKVEVIDEYAELLIELTKEMVIANKKKRIPSVDQMVNASVGLFLKERGRQYGSSELMERINAL